MVFKKIVQTTNIVTMSTLLLSACGSSGDDKDKNSDKETQPTTLTGVFIDSEVANIAYKTATIDGFTTSKGEFQYLDGESVVFSVGDIELPSVKAQSVITPLDITKARDIDDTQTANIARFLQSLDSDLETDGIQIDAKAHEKAKELQIENVDFTETAGFESAVGQLIADSGSSIKELVNKDKAVQHVQDTLDSFSKAKNRFFESELVGKTYYNTYFDEEQGNKWILQKIEFNENNQGTFTTGDSVTASTYSVINGLLKFAYNGRVDFAKIQTFNSSLDAYEICWLERIDENIVCSGNSIDYLFSDEQKAKSYINNKNQGTTNNTEFTAEMVLGKTFYNVYSDSDAGDKWVVETIVFTDGNSYTISQGDLSGTNTYAIVNGTIRLDEEGDDASFIKIQNFDDTLDAYKTCWLGSATESANCSDEGVEYLFTNEQKAINLAKSKNGFSINLVGKTATSVITKTGCQTKNSWNYSFTNTKVTQTGNDLWDENCQPKPERSFSYNPLELEDDDQDYAFICKDYPVCTEDDFKKTLTYTDGGGRQIVSTFTVVWGDTPVVTYNHKATENGSVTVINEVITIQ